MIHLTVIQDQASTEQRRCQGESETNARIWSSARHDFVWNDDFTSFQVVQLNYWDDDSYINYQAGLSPSDLDNEPDYEQERWEIEQHNLQNDPYRKTCEPGWFGSSIRNVQPLPVRYPRECLEVEDEIPF